MINETETTKKMLRSTFAAGAIECAKSIEDMPLPIIKQIMIDSGLSVIMIDDELLDKVARMFRIAGGSARKTWTDRLVASVGSIAADDEFARQNDEEFSND